MRQKSPSPRLEKDLRIKLYCHSERSETKSRNLIQKRSLDEGYPEQSRRARDDNIIMMKQDHILRFNNLSKFDTLIHGFSTRFFGSLRPSHEGYNQSLKKFAAALKISTDNLVRMNQMHTNKVSWVEGKDAGETIGETDGLVTAEKQVFLSVISADCLPLLFYDSKLNVVAAIHAGWRGLFAGIIKETISQMVVKGSNPKNILVGIGPSIRVCCYEVSEEFVDNFREKFEDMDNCVVRRDGKIFFDLQQFAIQQLLTLDIETGNIEDGDYCTFDHDAVYSCRREGKDFGEMMGIVGVG